MNGTGRLAPLLLVLVPALLPGQSGGTKANPQPPFVDVTAASKIIVRPPIRRHARQVHGRNVRLRRRLDRLRQRRLRRTSIFVNGAPGAANALYHNNKDGTFTDVTAEGRASAGAGNRAYKTGVAVGDYDNDGYLDLYVTALRPEHAAIATTATARSPT